MKTVELYYEDAIKEALADLDTIGRIPPMPSANASFNTNRVTRASKNQEKIQEVMTVIAKRF